MVVETRRWWRLACGWSLAMAIGASLSGAAAVDLPNRPDSLKFAIIGDFGTGDPPSYEVAARMTAFRARFPFEVVITTGDNIIGDQDGPSDLDEKFKRPFGPLLETGVRFYATLGNHDKKATPLYPPFNMDGKRYYTFARKNVRFFMLDSNRLDRPQLTWLEHVLRSSTDDWKIGTLHHPLYSSGLTHGPSLELRVILEPILIRYGVDAVFSGHDHVYERFRPQKGVHYFVVGPGGQEPRTMRPSEATAAAFDGEYSFMLVEVSGDALHFQAVSRTGAIVDSGIIHRRPKM